ncbi:hypothetical protein LXA43DRAFT_1180333 [Ganoderma leucocontextum]|nr:hypothetical protein LXA43DRAFT_1180333 [Ganoderma leucocontextum]
MATSRRDNWEPVRNPGWREFRNTYWGGCGRAALKNILEKPPLERFLYVEQACVRNLMPEFLPDGLFFVREEYLLFADRFRRAREEKPAPEMRGCLLLGQRGIGKSYFLLFFLMQCLSREETVLFTSSRGKMYLFHQGAVSSIWTSAFDCDEHLQVSVSDATRVWSLVDCPDTMEPIPSSVTDGSQKVFFVAAVSTDDARCKTLKERRTVRNWWMSPWSEEELRALLVSLSRTGFPFKEPERYPTFDDANVVRSLLQDTGPCLGDILLFLTDPSFHKQLVDAAVCRYTDNFRAICLLLSGVEAQPSEDPHKLVLISRAEPLSPDAVDNLNDGIVVRFKTRTIHERMLAKVLSFSTEETRRLYADFRLASMELWPSPPADFADFLFESMAVRYVLVDLKLAWSGKTYHQFASMTRIGPLPGTGRTTRARARAPVRLSYRPNDANARRSTVVVDVHRCIEWRGAELSPPPPRCNAWDPWANMTRRQRIVFDRVEDLQTLDGFGACYCPASAANSLFDAYFFLGVALWAVQIVTKPWDNSGLGGFDTVARLRELAGQLWSRSEIRVTYVIVVPYEEPGFGVEWHLPAGFEEHPGEVFVQFLDVGVFGGRVADVLGVPRPADACG